MTSTSSLPQPPPEGLAGRSPGHVMTRSEERLRVTTETEPYRRAVLRIETVTEEVLVPVTVSRQIARMEYLPLDEATPSTGLSEGSSSTPWVVLHEDHPQVVPVRTPVERVRLTTSWVTGEQEVTESLRHEEIVSERLNAGESGAASPSSAD